MTDVETEPTPPKPAPTPAELGYKQGEVAEVIPGPAGGAVFVMANGYEVSVDNDGNVIKVGDDEYRPDAKGRMVPARHLAHLDVDAGSVNTYEGREGDEPEPEPEPEPEADDGDVDLSALTHDELDDLARTHDVYGTDAYPASGRKDAKVEALAAIIG